MAIASIESGAEPSPVRGVVFVGNLQCHIMVTIRALFSGSCCRLCAGARMLYLALKVLCLEPTKE